MIPEKGSALPSTVVSALSKGEKIEAIKLLREARGIGLKEAKDIVEEYVETHPELSRQLAAAQGEMLKSFLRGLIAVAALSAAAYWFFFVK
jgi:ribosomal protein L7/L12